MKALLICFFACIFSLQLFAQTHNMELSSENQNSKWRDLKREGKYSEAITCLKKEFKVVSNRRQKHDVYWHIGQMHAFNNNYDSALVYIRKSTSWLTFLVDRQFYWYYRGTIAFLKRDREKLKRYHLKLWSNKNGYYRKNALMLKAMYDYFEKSYEEIYGTVSVFHILQSD